MRRALSFVTGVGLGVGLMYLLDPEQGEQRRNRLRDRISRLRDGAADARRALVPDHPSDALLVGRIRAKLGHHTTHPGAIEIEVHDGRVTLAGPILAGEVHAVLRAAGTTPGVREVENQLDPHDVLEGHPALQGGPASAEFGSMLRRNAAGVLAGAAGLVMAVAGARQIVRRSRVREAPVLR